MKTSADQQLTLTLPVSAARRALGRPARAVLRRPSRRAGSHPCRCAARHLREGVARGSGGMCPRSTCGLCPNPRFDDFSSGGVDTGRPLTGSQLVRPSPNTRSSKNAYAKRALGVAEAGRSRGARNAHKVRIGARCRAFGSACAACRLHAKCRALIDWQPGTCSSAAAHVRDDRIRHLARPRVCARVGDDGVVSASTDGRLLGHERSCRPLGRPDDRSSREGRRQDASRLADEFRVRKTLVTETPARPAAGGLDLACVVAG